MATRDFKNIPEASKPSQPTDLGKANVDIDKYIADNIEDPQIADKAKQAYTQQTVQSNELLSGSTLATPTTVGQQNINVPTVGLTSAQSQAIATPTA